MPSWAGRCLLFLLLVGDWVWDTRFGNNLFSQPMSSSLALHHSNPAQRIISQLSSTPRTPFAPVVQAEAVGQSLMPQATETESILPDTPLLYVLMSIRC
jgi:hypothetical protein